MKQSSGIDKSLVTVRRHKNDGQSELILCRALVFSPIFQRVPSVSRNL
jgi:hypothetical protein